MNIGVADYEPDTLANYELALAAMQMEPIPFEKCLLSNRALKVSPLMQPDFITTGQRSRESPGGFAEFAAVFAQDRQKDLQFPKDSPNTDLMDTLAFWGWEDEEGTCVSSACVGDAC